jgi:signal transduction histidine kinase
MWLHTEHQTRQIPRQSRSQLELLVLERTAELQNLSQQLLKVQDDERRRVARDLHDSTGQTLTALKISVAVLQRRLVNDKPTHDELSGIARLADEALREVRTTSYLLHPPMLDESGFVSAAQWYVDGFARRSGMKVCMDLAPQLPRLPKSMEIALFRVLQESLTNVHRHSGTSQVDLSFRWEAQSVILEVRDYGCGMPGESSNRVGPAVKYSGVGLAGMRERLDEIKGRLEIEAACPGTRLRAIVPVSADVSHSARDNGFSSISPGSLPSQMPSASGHGAPSC